MHELGIANSVLTAVRTELLRHPGAMPIKVGLRVGELAGVNPDSLEFSFQSITAGTEWEQLTLDIQTKPREHRCPSCDITFQVVDYHVACPSCGSRQTDCVSGDELEIAYLELEEP